MTGARRRGIFESTAMTGTIEVDGIARRVEVWPVNVGRNGTLVLDDGIEIVDADTKQPIEVDEETRAWLTEEVDREMDGREYGEDDEPTKCKGRGYE